jgi:hypothetical protein
MSRSIHATIHQWAELGRWQFSDPGRQADLRAEVVRQVFRKRRIKRQTLAARGRRAGPTSAPRYPRS